MSSVTLKLSSLDLGAAKHVDGLALQTYDPANEYAKSKAEIREEKIVIVGLSAKPIWEYVSGVASGEKKEGVASLLGVMSPES